MATGIVPIAANVTPGTTHGKYRGIVFLRMKSTTSPGGYLAGVNVGDFGCASEAWEAAGLAARSDDAFGHTIEIVEDGSRKEGRTIADARKLVFALRELVDRGVDDHDLAKAMHKGLQLLENTLSRGCTEVDEALARLSLSTKPGRKEARNDFSAAVGMLHRWQGRNGHVGNISVGGRP